MPVLFAVASISPSKSITITSNEHRLDLVSYVFVTKIDNAFLILAIVFYMDESIVLDISNLIVF
ncbi:hypothetical protein [Neptuniibacter pectenicola]|jgi:hypothetical protein|uniref:hypothetical protein n=1 Tax=Neptuniibacter pectenicola TaxID=1806669 RepID=UPI00079A444F|nr:hypothetical protein [Neptuniibacter pectenicola]KXJ51363.1 MAG: hypothetical protein AXW15_04735 [Neptuniibacter sp. Phe_28]|tara:strand:+ start:76 stop:267 length:192 start_codon:yes stop_codon:yes gene_type:complete